MTNPEIINEMFAVRELDVESLYDALQARLVSPLTDEERAFLVATLKDARTRAEESVEMQEAAARAADEIPFPKERGMAMLCVRQVGSSNREQQVKDIDGTLYKLEKDQPLYLANTTFSKPNAGFLMTRDGRYVAKTEGCELSNEEITDLLPKAKAKLDSGKEGKLGMKFTL